MEILNKSSKSIGAFFLLTSMAGGSVQAAEACPYPSDSIEYDIHCTDMFDQDDVEDVLVTGSRPPSPPPINNNWNGITVQPSHPEGGGAALTSNEQEAKEKAQEECFDHAELESKICTENALATHLTRYRLCESVHWSGWVLNFVSLGRMGSVPDTCGSKLQISTDLALAQCETDFTVNKQLCK